jgi:uncharacterized membrane protein
MTLGMRGVFPDRAGARLYHRVDLGSGIRMGKAHWIQVFLFLHVMGAIAALGPTLTYGLWTALGDRGTPAERVFAIRGIRWVDNHLATPAFVAQAITGISLILLLGISFLHTAWLLCGVALYVVLVAFAMAVYAPVVRAQAEAAERAASDPPAAAEYAEISGRSRAFGVIALVLTVAIVYFMVVKPALWSAG